MSEYEIKRDLFLETLRQEGFQDAFEEVTLDSLVGFRSFQDMNNGRCMIAIMLDDSMYSTISIIFGSLDNVGKKEKILDLFNDLNQSYKSSKFYLNDNNEFVAQTGYTATSKEFNGELLLTSVLSLYRDIEDKEYAKVMRVLWS